VYLALNKKQEARKDPQQAVEYEFTKVYGEEVNELVKKHSIINRDIFSNSTITPGFKNNQHG